MFDIGATELLVIAIVAIVVVGPKDLPRMLRTVGQFVGKAKAMAREFQMHFNAAADEAGLDEVRKGIESVSHGADAGSLKDAFKPLSDAGRDLQSDITRPERTTAKPTPVPAGADVQEDAQPQAGDGAADGPASSAPPPEDGAASPGAGPEDAASGDKADEARRAAGGGRAVSS